MRPKPRPRIILPPPPPTPPTEVFPVSQDEQILDELANLIGGNGAVNVGGFRGFRGGTKFFVLAASATAVWKPDGDRILRRIEGDNVQYALTRNGMTYTTLSAMTGPSELGGNQVLIYSNAAVHEGLNIFIAAGETLTLSNSSSGTNKITLTWDYVNAPI